ncbi:MAG TPA: Rrf2 family transcriptional regulator [Bacteroidales bacterium]|nr:Rrf2 family transcriptional regulator [Bacteroidales bacterium]
MSKIITISEAASIAIHAMVIIASANEPIKVNQLSDLTGASKNHLAKVMNILSKCNMVKSTRGPSGGFSLNKPANTISLLNIYECIEGPIIYEGCPLNRPFCPFDKCLLDGAIKRLSDELKSFLSNQYLNLYLK